jgi:pimeloyl-ACP methyl ester carboxylesterase
MTNMKRGITVFLFAGALVIVGYFTVNRWAIRHESFTFYDPDRDNRPVAVDIAIRWDKQMKAEAGMIKLPVVVFSHGNTVKSTEYSFINNLFAAHGYMVLSIQHDLPTDMPMVTKPDELYDGRLPQILRGVANIKFAVHEMQKVEPNADYDRLTVAGHSMGGDITMYFAKQYPDRVKTVVTLDNLRVPFITSGTFKILSFRSNDPQFKTDPGVIPSAQQRENAGIAVVNTPFRHDDMRDTGSVDAKASIDAALDKFLTETDNNSVTPVEPCTPNIVGPVPTCVLVAPAQN